MENSLKEVESSKPMDNKEKEEKEEKEKEKKEEKEEKENELTEVKIEVKAEEKLIKMENDNDLASLEKSVADRKEKEEKEEKEEKVKISFKNKMVKCWNKFINIKWNSIFTLISLIVFVVIYVISFTAVPSSNSSTNIIIIIALSMILSIILVRHYDYVKAIWKEEYNDNIRWHVKRILWNSFLMVLITFFSVFSLWFFAIRSQDIQIFDDLINNFSVLQLIVFIIDVLCFFIVLSLPCRHINWHTNNIYRLYVNRGNKENRENIKED